MMIKHNGCPKCGDYKIPITTFMSCEGRPPDVPPARLKYVYDCSKCGKSVQWYENGKLINQESE